MPEDTQVSPGQGNALTDAERAWVEQFGAAATTDQAKRATAEVREALLGDVYARVDALTGDMRDAFTFDVIRLSSSTLKRFFGAKDTFHSISEVNRDTSTRAMDEELDVFYDLRRVFDEENRDGEADDRMSETARRLQAVSQRDDFRVVDADHADRSATEVLSTLEDNMKRVKAMVTRMESAVDANGQRLFSDADIRDEVFLPMVREGIFPESMVPDRFSEVAQTFKGASDAYHERLVEWSKENPNGDRNHAISFAAEICKKSADLALSNVKLVAACGGPAEAVKVAEFAKLAVSFTADATVTVFEKRDADGLLDSFKATVVGGIGTFGGDDNVAALVGGILTGAIGGARGARAAIQAGDPAAALNEIANMAVGICASVASGKSEEEAAAINGVASIVSKSVKAGTATVMTPIAAYRSGASGKDAALKALDEAFQAVASNAMEQACGAVRAPEVSKAGDEAREKAAKKGKSDKDIEKAGEKAEGKAQDEVDGDAETAGDEAAGLVGASFELLGALSEDVNAVTTANERHAALLAVLSEKAVSAEKTIDDLKNGVASAGAIEMARLVLGRNDDDTAKRLKDGAGDLRTFLAGPEVDGKAPRERLAVHLQSLNLKPDQAIKDLEAEEESEGSLAVADYLLVASTKGDQVDSFLKTDGTDPEAAKKALSAIQDAMADMQVKAAQEALMEEGRAFREAMEQGFDLPTDPEELAEQEAQRQLSKIEPLIRQLKQDQQLMDLASKMVNGGVNMIAAFLPPAGIASAGIAMMEELHKVYQRQKEFLLWMDNMRDAKAAASVHVEGFLNRVNLSDRQRIEHGMQAALKCAQMIGKILETAGVAHPAVLAAGKIVSASAETATVAFDIAKTVRTEAEMRAAWNTYQKALANPRSRKLARRALRQNPTLAKYAIAYGATVANNLVARQAMLRCGLTPEVLQDADTNVDKVVEYLETLYPEDPVLERQVPTDAWFPRAFKPDAEVWVSFVLAARTKASPKLKEDNQHKPVTGLFVALQKAISDYEGIIPADAETSRAALERILARTRELRTTLDSFKPVDTAGKPHEGMRNASVGFIQATAAIEAKYQASLEGLA